VEIGNKGKLDLLAEATEDWTTEIWLTHFFHFDLFLERVSYIRTLFYQRGTITGDEIFFLSMLEYSFLKRPNVNT
jgi:hypothetical protein